MPLVANAWPKVVAGVVDCLRILRSDTAIGGDEAFRDLVLARILEPTSKADSLHSVLTEHAVQPADCRTVTRRLAMVAKPSG
ncbi:hypothetical protein B8W66_08085 [Mycobacterium decipiens]|uniref:Uncharacterized protein n=1 Tax=Mycobacterium decipiens TaxID=1430326 RepID=A0A1X2LX70_9MYCO|nr:hypothetical protein B8W66_08085 [Mycobacterium decipiens]